MPHPRSAPEQLPLPWTDHLPPPAQACRRCGRPLSAALAVRYGLGERCHVRALADHDAQPVDITAALRGAVDAARAAPLAAPVLPLPRRPDRPGA